MTRLKTERSKYLSIWTNNLVSFRFESGVNWFLFSSSVCILLLKYFSTCDSFHMKTLPSILFKLKQNFIKKFPDMNRIREALKWNGFSCVLVEFLFLHKKKNKPEKNVFKTCSRKTILNATFAKCLVVDFLFFLFNNK